MSEEVEKKDFLKNVSLFDGIQDSDKEKIEQVVLRGTVPSGTVFFKEGEAGDAFYVITSGEVAVIKNDGDKESLIAVIKGTDENNFFGEMALVGDLPRSATVVARTDCSILEIEKKSFDMLLRINSFVALRIMTALTKRLRADSLTQASVIEKSPAHSAKIISFFSPKGGSGKTTIATNVAAGLAQYLNKKVLLIDLDLQFGDIAFMLKLKVSKTIYDVANDGSLNSFDELRVAFVKHDTGFDLLPSPRKPEESEAVDSNHLKKIISLCKSQYDYILIDTHSLLQDLSINALDISDKILLVMLPEVNHALAIRNCLHVMESLKYSKEKINLVLNRQNCQNSIPKDQVNAFLGKQNSTVKYFINDDWKACSNLVNDGAVIFGGSENSSYRSDICNIISDITGEKMPAESAGKGKSIFSGFCDWLNS